MSHHKPGKPCRNSGFQRDSLERRRRDFNSICGRGNPLIFVDLSRSEALFAPIVISQNTRQSHSDVGKCGQIPILCASQPPVWSSRFLSAGFGEQRFEYRNRSWTVLSDGLPDSSLICPRTGVSRCFLLSPSTAPSHARQCPQPQAPLLWSQRMPTRGAGGKPIGAVAGRVCHRTSVLPTQDASLVAQRWTVWSIRREDDFTFSGSGRLVGSLQYDGVVDE